MKTYSLEEVKARWSAVPKYRKVYYALYRLLRKPRKMLQEIKWFWQRGRRGWAICDSWSADEYLNKVFIGILNSLISRNLSYPMDLTETEWLEILTQMRDGFIAAQEFTDGLGGKGQRDLNLAKFENGMKLVTEYWFSLWD